MSPEVTARSPSLHMEVRGHKSNEVQLGRKSALYLTMTGVLSEKQRSDQKLL